MRTSSNPVFRNLPKQQGGGYANFGSAAAGASQMTQQYGSQQYGPQYDASQQYPAGPAQRAMTIDDVVTKTGITLGVLSLAAVVSYFFVRSDASLAAPLALGGGLIGFVLVLVAVFGRKSDNPAIVLAYAAAQGVFLGALSYLFTGIEFGGTGGSALIGQAILGTFGVFFGMLVVYKTGAIRVTPRFTRMLIGALIGVTVLALGNLLFALIGGGDGLGLRSGGTIAIIFSLVCIAIAAFSFLLDFDQADQLIRAGAPERAAWSVAFGLTVTLVWLYVEILRLLSYFQND